MKLQLIAVLLVFICFTKQTVAQSETGKSKNKQITYKELGSKKKMKQLLPDHIKDNGSEVLSFEVKVACSGQESTVVNCTGEELCPEFFKEAEKSKDNECLYYFDKIKTNTPRLPIAGFIVEVKSEK